MSKLFVSHSPQNEPFVRQLQKELGGRGQNVWIDSRELRGGDPVWPDIQRAISEASAFVVVVSPHSLQSKWIGREVRYALEQNKKVIPLSLDGTKLGVLEDFFPEEPLYVPVSMSPRGVETAVNAVLIALEVNTPADFPSLPHPATEPVEELVLELTDLKFHEQDGVRRPSARARLVYEPATPGQRDVTSAQSWRFIATIGPIEAEELRWYLEKFAVWPSEYFRDRARKVEESLVDWGRLLHDAALPSAYTSNVLQAWAWIDAGRRFSVLIDPTLDAGASDADIESARECATLLLGLPWELLHDGHQFLFEGVRPTVVRRRLPSTRARDVPVVSTPIRILLVSPRPENDACAYLDHRATALPLIEAMESLGGLVHIHALDPPTLNALRDELERARREGKPYHVVHFDGHGIYDRLAGLGGLCFEDPQDISKLEKRRHQTVYTSELGPLLLNQRVPLLFLEACQTAQAEKAAESVASEMLKVGVASVVAMSHSVLVETARRFVEVFYDALAGGARVGDAVLLGRHALKDDTFRGRIFGAGELRLEDWFVPVLFQEKDDPQLFRTAPGRQTQENVREALAARFGELPPEPETGFIGRSRELLALQRLLRYESYALVRGQGGEGKTALAAELARWMVRSRQIDRATFVSVQSHTNVAGVLDAIGRQLLPAYSVAEFESLEQGIVPVERALVAQSTLLVIDNMENILPPRYADAPEALSEEGRRELGAILQLCARLNAVAHTRLLFTSREPLPSPFDAERNRRELYRLEREDGVKLVERALNLDAEGAGAAADAARAAIEELVDTAQGHALTLMLLAPHLRNRGVEATRVSLAESIGEVQQQLAGIREKSLFASIALSLPRLSAGNREKARVLGVFHGVVDLDMLRAMMDWDEREVVSLVEELVETGLATPNPFSHLTLNPALCPFLRGKLSETERESFTARWVDVMRQYVEFLRRSQSERAEIAATLTLLELPNLFALLDHVQRTGDVEATISVATSLYTLLQGLGKPRLLERVAEARDAAAASLGKAWNHVRFEVQRAAVQRLLDSGYLREAVNVAEELLRRAREAGETAYPGADYDLAAASTLLGRALKTAGAAAEALPFLEEAQHRFESIERERPGRGAEVMASICLGELGDCLAELGRLNDAAEMYEKNIRRAEARGDERAMAIGNVQMGSIHMTQHRYADALSAYHAARERFERLNEPRSIAVTWHRIGMIHQNAGEAEAAEDAYQRSLRIETRLGNADGQATTLGQLGILYDDVLGRPEQALAFYASALSQVGRL